MSDQMQEVRQDFANSLSLIIEPITCNDMAYALGGLTIEGALESDSSVADQHPIAIEYDIDTIYGSAEIGDERATWLIMLASKELVKTDAAELDAVEADMLDPNVVSFEEFWQAECEAEAEVVTEADLDAAIDAIEEIIQSL